MEIDTKKTVKEVLTEEEVQNIPGSLARKLDLILMEKVNTETELLKSEQQIQDLNHQLEELKEKYECKKSELVSASQQIHRLQQEVVEANHNGPYHNLIRNLNHQFDEFVCIRESLQASLEAKTSELQTANEENEALMESFNQCTTAYKNQLEQYRYQFYLFGQQLQQETHLVGLYSERSNKLTRTVSELKHENEALKSQLRESKEENCNLLNEIKELRPSLVTNRVFTFSCTGEIKSEYNNYHQETSTNMTIASGSANQQTTSQIAIAMSHIEMLNKNIKMLTEKKNDYNCVITRNEQLIQTLTADLLHNQRKLTSAETLLHNVQQENGRLVATNNCLVSERNDLQSKIDDQKLHMRNLESVKSTLEQNALEVKKQNEKCLNKAFRESHALRQQLQEVQEHFRNHSATLEQQAVNDRMELTSLRKELQKASCIIDEIQHNVIDDGNPLEQIRGLEHEVDEKPEIKLLEQKVNYVPDLILKKLHDLNETYQKYKADMEFKLQQSASAEYELRQKIASYKQEQVDTETKVQVIKQQLHSAQLHGENYVKQFTELNETYQKYKADMESKLQQSASAEYKLKQKIASYKQELVDTETKVQVVKQQLHSAQLQAENYVKQFTELNETYQKYKADVEMKLRRQTRIDYELRLNIEQCEKYQKQNADLQTSLSQQKKSEYKLRQKILHHERELIRQTDKHRETENELRDQLMKATHDLNSINDELQNLKVKFEASELDKIQLGKSLQKVENKYTTEVIHHSTDIQTLATLKEEVIKLNKELKSSRDAGKIWMDMETNGKRLAFYTERKQMKMRVKKLETENSELQNQLETLKEKLSKPHVQQAAEENAKKVDELSQMIEDLRNENKILTVELNMLKMHMT